MKKLKHAKTDFKYSSLPQNRKAMFFDLYRNQFGSIIKVGLWLLLFSLPLIAFIAFMDIFLIGINQNLTGEDLTSTLLWWEIIYNVGFIILLFVVEIGLSGLIRVVRQLTWSEGVDFKYDMKTGIKQNYPHFALSTGIFATIYLMSYFISIFFLESTFSFLPILLFSVLFLPIYFWYQLLSNIYESNFKEYFKNGAFFFVKTAGYSLLLTFITILPLGLNLLPATLISIKNLLIIIIIMFCYPAVILVWSLYSLSKFDIYLNEEYYPELVRKGLFDPNELKKKK